MAFFEDEVGQSARDRFSEALAHIMLRWKDPNTHEEKKPGHPFFHTFASSLRYVETDGFERMDGKKDPLPLAAVGFVPNSPVGRLYINPTNFLNLNIRKAAGLVVHEILHIVYDHLHYEQARTHPKIWNIATDCTINQQVIAMGYDIPNGKGILADDMEHDVRCIMPDVLGETFKCAPPKANENALFYFDWIIQKLKEQEEKQEDCPACGGSGQQPKKDKQDDQDCPVHGDKGQKGDKGDDGDQGGKGDGESDQQGEDEADGGKGKNPGQNGEGDGPGEGDGDGDPSDNHEHGDSGKQCNCPDHNSGNGEGQGEGEGQDQGDGSEQGNQGQNGSGGTEPCD